MKAAVRYYSRGGNTKKLAETIAAAAGVEALSVDCPLEEDTRIVFLGSSVYAAGVDEAVVKFLRENREHIGTLYSFSTAAVMPSTYKQIQKLAAENNITLSDREFHCRGSFLFMHRGHPDDKDLLRAGAFAKLILQKED